MHAVIITVDIDPSRAEEARKGLEEFVVPHAAGRAGFVSGTWLETADGTQGIGVVLTETAEDAKALGEDAKGAGPEAPVTFRSAEVHEVVATA